MKKFRIMIILFILTFSFSVKAEIFMEMDCRSKNISIDNSVTCEGNLIYEIVSISDIEFEYETNLDINFIPISGYDLIKNGNKITIHANTPLYDEIMNATTIFKFSVKGNSNSKEKEALTFKNFKINNSTSEEVFDVSETFNVERKIILDNNCTLDSITVEGVSIPNFNKDVLEYRNITVDKNVVFIDAVRSSEKSSASGLGQIIVKPGETICHEIYVTAEDDTQKIYKLYITNTSEAVQLADEPDENKEKENDSLSADNTLKLLELYVLNEKINFNFNSEVSEYNIKIEKDNVEKIKLTATPNDSSASFVTAFGPRDIKITPGENKVLVKVKASNGDIKTYTLNINYLNTDNKLSLLKVNDKQIKLVDGLYKYEINVSNSETKSRVVVKANNEKAKVDYKDIDLSNGDNILKITVTAPNNDKKEYVINIIRSIEEEIDNVFQNIQIDGYDLDFNKDKKDYELRIGEDTKELKIIVTPSDIDYKIENNHDLSNGSIVSIKINDDTGTSEYNIRIIKEEKNDLLIYVVIGLVEISLIITIIYFIRKRRKVNDIEII